MRSILTLFFILIYSFTFAQTNESSIEFTPTFNNLPLALDKFYRFNNDSLKISLLKFYISNINFYKDNQLVDAVSKKYNLIDIERPETLLIKFSRNNSKSFNRILFNIGIDSLTNLAGALGKDLDPTNGMYWTWQSGYINLKMEGQSNICPSRNNLFIFHIGGYRYPFNSIQTIDFSIKENNKIVFNLDIFTLINKLNLNETFEVMSPCKNSLTIAQQFSNSIKAVE